LAAAVAVSLFAGCSKDKPPEAPPPAPADAAQPPVTDTAPAPTDPTPTNPDLAATGTTLTAGASPEELEAAWNAWQPSLPPNKLDVTPVPGVEVLTEAQQNQVVVSPERLRFKAADHPDVLAWPKGKVLVSAPAAPGSPGRNPLGFARKVERVEQVGEDIVVTTTAPALEEIIQGELQVEFDPETAHEVDWAALEPQAEWVADRLYTNSGPLTDTWPEMLRDDGPAAAAPQPDAPGDPLCCGLDVVKSVASSIGDKIGSAANTVVNVAKSAAGAVVNAGKAVGSAVATAGNAVGGAVVTAGKAIGGFVVGVASASARTATSIAGAIYEGARTLYEKIMPKSLSGDATFDPSFDFNAINLNILKYDLKKTFNESGTFPIEAGFKADSNLRGNIKFKPKLSLGAEIPNPLAIGDIPPLRVWLDVDAALEVTLTLDLLLEATLTSAGGKAGSKLEAALNQASDFAGPVLNTFRKQLFGNEDVKPAGNWKKTVFLSKPKYTIIPIGKFPLVLTATFQVDIDCGFELKATLNADATLTSVHTLKYRAQYTHGTGFKQTPPEYKHTPRTEVRVLGGGEASVVCSVIPRVNAFLYDTIGLNAGVRGSVIARAKYESTCSPAKTAPSGEVSLSLNAGLGLPVGARLQVPGSSWGGKDALDAGFDVGPLEIWNKEFTIFEKKWDVPGLGYCTPTCSNGRTGKGETETDLDCGGECPQGCAESKMCKVNSDCQQGLFCVSGRCSQSHCGDGVLSGTETGVDCGGPTCNPCGVGHMCKAGGDCASKSCGTIKHPLLTLHVCVENPCTDGQRSPGECGIDCGGACGLCPAGAACGDPKQCQSGQSNRYQCTACGGFGGACCEGGTCGSGGLVCQGGTCQCPADRGVACGDGCCAAGQLCEKGACVDPAPTCLAIPTVVRGTCTDGACPRSCSAQLQMDPRSQSGVYTIQPDRSKPPFEVRCDMSRDGGGWTLVGFEPAGLPAAKGTGVMASLFAETGTPSQVATGSGAAFIGPRFSFGRGDYTHLRLDWCDPSTSKNVYQSFRTSEEIFADGQRAANGTISLSEFQSNDSLLNQQIPTPDAARFCRARTSTLRPGDTSWGIKGASESNFGCGCNSGGWAGVGSYYGGTGDQCTSCSCFGGGWAGTAGNGVPKGGVNRHTLYLWIR
jgi:hypothetical protein